MTSFEQGPEVQKINELDAAEQREKVTARGGVALISYVYPAGSTENTASRQARLDEIDREIEKEYPKSEAEKQEEARQQEMRSGIDQMAADLRESYRTTGQSDFDRLSKVTVRRRGQP